jgi:hypothetical protein
LQTSQYAVLGVLPMNLAILSLRSGIAPSWQGEQGESNVLLSLRGRAEALNRKERKEKPERTRRKPDCLSSRPLWLFFANFAVNGFPLALRS